MNADIHGSAVFSECGGFRHRLDRWWADGPRALICMANPSTAGADENDPTIHRVVSLIRPRWPGFIVVNRSARIATDPADHAAWENEARRVDPGWHRAVVERNFELIRQRSESASIRIAAWGDLGTPVRPGHRVVAALSCDGQFPIYCWGMTKSGAPKHPLARGKSRIPENMEPIIWLPARAAELDAQHKAA